MLRIKAEYFPDRPCVVREVAQQAKIDPCTLNRIIHGKQRPGFGPGQSAERIAEAVGWKGDVGELFKEV